MCKVSPSPPAPLPQGYGVHRSLEIPPSTWFRHLTNGCAIAPEASHCEEERRSNRKNHGIM
ncbi:hypothetical protein FDUTEX481_05759 [Tolypothrix sp. PCC 7601]|nr:hypothetical protein FDUTEX481_05759 [Tolypothrix sp. PCC 7601]